MTLLNCTECFAGHAHWLLRAGLASVFLYHGIGKFADLGAFSDMMGLPMAIAALVAVAEVGGSLFLLAGGWLKNAWLTRLGAAAFIPVMIGAIAMVHWPRWSFAASDTHPMGGMEFQVVLMLVSLYLVLRGNQA